MTSWTILSRGGATVSGLSPPEALGIITLLPGVNWNESFLISFIMSFITSMEKPSSVVGVIPGVILPGLLFRFWYAISYKVLLYINLYMSRASKLSSVLHFSSNHRNFLIASDLTVLGPPAVSE